MTVTAARHHWHHWHQRPAIGRFALLIAVILMHLMIVMALLYTRTIIASAGHAAAPIVVTLLPLDEPAEPPATAPAPPTPARSDARAAPVSPAPAPPPRPSVDAAPPATPPTAPSQAEAGADDGTVYDIDTGAGGGPGLTPPHWVHKVTDEEFFPLVDEELLRGRLEVELRMACTVALDTRVACEVLREWPVYPGIRRAVRQAVPLLRMAPGKRNGRPIADQRVTFLWRINVDRRALFER